MINEKTWCFSPETYALLRKKQTAEIDAWLDEHVAQETGYVLDDSLTLENAAAQAKAVGDEIARVDNALVIGMNTLANAAWSAVNTAYTAGKAVFAYTYSNHPVLYELVDCYEESMIGYERKDFIFRAITASNASGADVSTVLLKRTGNGVSYEYEWSDATTVSLVSQASLSAAEQQILASFPTDSITDAAIASIEDGADGIPVKALTVNITPVQAAGTPTPENPLPISGWTGVKIARTADNLLDRTCEKVSGYYDGDGVYHESTSGTFCTVPSIPVDGSTDYVMLLFAYAAVQQCYFYDADKNWISRSAGTYAGSEQTGVYKLFTTPANCAYVRFQGTDNSSNWTDTTLPLMFAKGSTITNANYQPFGGYFTVSWQSEAETVYGGTLTDNGDGTWTLKARPYYASYAGEALVGPWVSSMDEYAEGTTPTTGAQVVDLGGAETEYTLTADSVKTLLGQNNIFADCGNIAELTYRADTKLYIDKKIGDAIGGSY